MYSINVEIEGTAPLLQHRFGMAAQIEGEAKSKKRTGKIDYSEEWRETCYFTPENELYQPANHLEMSMIKAAVSFKIPGKRGKTYKDLFKAAVFVQPDALLLGRDVPKEPPIYNGTGTAPEGVYVDLRPVVIQRSRVMRTRLAFSPGWKLAFEIQVIDDQLHHEVVNEVLVESGQKVGIGDYRPRFGRFIVIKFEAR